MTVKKIKIGRKAAQAFCMKLQSKSLIVIRANKGYIMCGYLNMDVAEKFGDAAIKITGVSNIKEALNSTVADCTQAAKQLGVRKGQTIKEALRLIA